MEKLIRTGTTAKPQYIQLTPLQQDTYSVFSGQYLPSYKKILAELTEDSDPYLNQLVQWAQILNQRLKPGTFINLLEAWEGLLRQMGQILIVNMNILKALSHIMLRLHTDSQQNAWKNEFLKTGSIYLKNAKADGNGLKKIAVFIAWKQGLASARELALEAVSSLPEQIQYVLLSGYPLKEWQANPWFKPRHASKNTPVKSNQGNTEIQTLAIVKTAGGLMGWQGRFYEPPLMHWLDTKSILLQDSQNTWLVRLDAWGETWKRVQHPNLNSNSHLGNWVCNQNGAVKLEKYQREFPELKYWKQAVACEHTLAISLAHSLKIYFIGLQLAS